MATAELGFKKPLSTGGADGRIKKEKATGRHGKKIRKRKKAVQQGIIDRGQREKQKRRRGEKGRKHRGRQKQKPRTESKEEQQSGTWVQKTEWMPQLFKRIGGSGDSFLEIRVFPFFDSS